MSSFRLKEQHHCEDQIGAALRTIDVLNLLAKHQTQPHLIREIAHAIRAQRRIIKRERDIMPAYRREDET